ncbi:two-component sensor histidine kinase, partial [Streptomyces sp. TRM76130]|nr:two-component sensor histidine kinase [Streptomyces sp. TRM76130]
MTETTQIPPTTPSSPEVRLAANALRGLRQDLFANAFAYRPLPRMRVDGPFTRRLPGRLREYAERAPHAVVLAAGLLAMTIGGTEVSGHDNARRMLNGALALIPVLLLLVRPVGAFWCSLAAAPVTA